MTHTARYYITQAAVFLTLVGWPSSATAAPANDAFTSAQVLTGTTVSVTGTNVDATVEPGEPAHAGRFGDGHSVWYRWTPPEDLPVTISLCDSSFDTLLAVYTGTSVDSLTEVARNDDDDRFRCPGLQSEVKFDAIANTTYHIAVDGGFDETGTIVLELIDRRPPNDTLAGAEVLTGYAASASNTNGDATMEQGEPDQGGRASHSVWYRWTAPSGGVVTMDVCRSTFDTLLSIYSGQTVTGLTPLVSNDNGCGRQSRVVYFAQDGTTYQIRVAGAKNSSGRIRLRIELPKPGSYSGKTEFLDRKPISFNLRSNGKTVDRLTVNSTMDCKVRGSFVGEFKLKDIAFNGVSVGRDDEGAAFLVNAKIKLKGGGALFFTVKGSFDPPDRATGKLETRAELPDGVTCKNWLGTVRWTVRHK